MCDLSIFPQVAVFIWSTLQTKYGLFNPRSYWTYSVEYLINVLSILLATTLYAGHPVLLSTLLLTPLSIVYFFPPSSSQKMKMGNRIAKLVRSKNKSDTIKAPHPLPKRPFLTNYRGSMLIITSLSILSIDFSIFPRRFAKVETWGTSLMDVGVGSFVFSSGIVAARPLLLTSSTQANFSARIKSAGRHSLPLLILGLLRLWSVKELNYAEHVSEYGVHWNFFFTLGLLPPFVILSQSALRYIPSYAGLAVLIGIAYQLTLELTSLKSYMLTSPRVNFMSMNREGIFSFTGYLSIFLIGQEMGLFVLPRKLLPKTFPAWQQRKRLLILLIGWSLTWTFLFLACINRVYGLNMIVSRRLANLPYIFWVVSFNTCQLTVFCLIETLFFSDIWRSSDRLTRSEEEELYQSATSGVLEAYNRNGLAIFLLANLLTGAINISIPTLDLSDLSAMVILIIYGGAVTGAAIFLDTWNISIKL